MWPLIVNSKVCYKEYSVYMLKWSAVMKKVLAQCMYLAELSYPMLLFSKFSQNRVVSITDYGKSWLIRYFSLMEINTNNLGNFWVLFLWKLGFKSASKSMSAHEDSAGRLSITVCWKGLFFFFWCSNASQSCVYKHCQKQRVLGIFHLKEKWQKE